MKTKKDRILQLVLSDENLIKKYQVAPDRYPTLHEALYAEDAIVASIAMIIDAIKDDFDKSDMDNLYKKIRKNLNDTLLI